MTELEERVLCFEFLPMLPPTRDKWVCPRLNCDGKASTHRTYAPNGCVACDRCGILFHWCPLLQDFSIESPYHKLSSYLPK